MSDITQLLSRIESGDQTAANQLFPLVYDELRRMARSQMAGERADHTLQPTILVHEAYVRLLGNATPHGNGRGHFFTAIAEAMRRILIDHARAKKAAKRGGEFKRKEIDERALSLASTADGMIDVLTLDEALTKLAAEAPAKAQLVKLRFYAGLSLEEAAKAMNISPATAKRYWVFSRAWLFQELEASQP